MSIRNYDSWLLSGPGGPDDLGRDPSKLVEDVMSLLEAADAPQGVVDAVVAAIEKWEDSEAGPEADPYVPDGPGEELP